jgi:hypothetical protein
LFKFGGVKPMHTIEIKTYMVKKVESMLESIGTISGLWRLLNWPALANFWTQTVIGDQLSITLPFSHSASDRG